MNMSVESRIKRVLNGLSPATGFESKFNPPETLQSRMAYYHTPGVSIAVINEFEIEWARGFGVRDVRSKNEVTAETLFEAGSISKPLFALGVMRLAQEGSVDLDEDIHKYLSSWHVPANEGWQPKITLRQILSHTAGFTVGGFPGYQASEPKPTVPQILNGEYPAKSHRVEVNILPGTQIRYSGGGYTAAQQAIVDLLGKPFPQIMNELVIEPLGLTNSTFRQPLPEQWSKKAATAHPRKGIPLKGKYHTYPEMAAAGLWTTPTDMAKLGVELLKTLRDKKSDSFLTKETIEMMLKPQLADQKIGEGIYMGLGFYCNGKDGGFSFGHSGWVEGFGSEMSMYKNIGKGAIVMLNSSEGLPLIDEILRAIGIEDEWPDILVKQKERANLANIHDYAGLYVTGESTQFQVNVAGEDLQLQYNGQPPLPIIPASEDEFFTQALNTNFHFEKDDLGRIISLTINQEGKQIKADRQINDQSRREKVRKFALRP